MHPPANHAFARDLVALAESGDLEGAGAIIDEVRALGGDKDRGTAVHDEWGVAGGDAGEASKVIDGVDEGGRNAATGRQKMLGSRWRNSDAGRLREDAVAKEGDDVAWVMIGKDG